ncbi:hypothetical protein [uncultured Tyzzerella sp.]|uniref:hypothetical protein n=1 Tax=uncultured Tyzzerella sp. TaxID=2321398 RepID=UPI002942D3E6|nr:hypothetical protein [uncultured Tyzzerella sp.]
MNDTKEFIEYKFLELKKYIDECFEEQSKSNSIFFDNILELIKANINKENELNNSKILYAIEELKKATEVNKAISNKLVDDLKELDDIYGIGATKENNKIIYKDIKKGIKQFSIQLIIVVGILLIILGAYQLINLIF